MHHPTGQPRPARRPRWRAVATATVLALAVSAGACSGGSGAGDGGDGDRGDGGTGATPTTVDVSDMDDLELATTAYVAGYPLVVTTRTLQRLGGLIGVNQLFWQTALSGPESRVIVAPNRDTLYSIAVLDLRAGPMVLTLPEVTDRYYTYQLLDAWTANVAEEAVYPIARRDADGGPFDGRHTYRLTFPPGGLPPVEAFWSLSVYGDDMFFVPHPRGRYTIGDRTPGLVTAADGSLEITLAHDDPGPGTNWLPVPDGPFVLMLRLYLPGTRVVDGSYDYPDVERVDAAA